MSSWCVYMVLLPKTIIKHLYTHLYSLYSFQWIQMTMCMALRDKLEPCAGPPNNQTTFCNIFYSSLIWTEKVGRPRKATGELLEELLDQYTMFMN